MAYAATVLDEFRLSYEKSNLDAHDNRFSNYGAYATFLKDTPNLIPGYAEFVAGRASAARTVSIPVLTRQTLSTASVRSCTPTYNQATSAINRLSTIRLKLSRKHSCWMPIPMLLLIWLLT